MEIMPEIPAPDEAAAALVDAESSRTRLAEGIAVPSLLYASLGTAIAAQIATTALGLAGVGRWPGATLLAGAAMLIAVAGVQLVRFRRLNGVWLGGFASRVVGGTATAASISYTLALGAAIWAAYARAGWLVAVCSLAGGTAYALSGRRWVRIYRAEPAKNSRGESAAWLAVAGVLATAGLVLLMIGR